MAKHTAPPPPSRSYHHSQQCGWQVVGGQHVHLTVLRLPLLTQRHCWRRDNNKKDQLPAALAGTVYPLLTQVFVVQTITPLAMPLPSLYRSLSTPNNIVTPTPAPSVMHRSGPHQLTCSDADTKKYCCLSLSSLPSGVLSLGYSTALMAAARSRSAVACC